MPNNDFQIVKGLQDLTNKKYLKKLVNGKSAVEVSGALKHDITRADVEARISSVKNQITACDNVITEASTKKVRLETLITKIETFLTKFDPEP